MARGARMRRRHRRKKIPFNIIRKMYKKVNVKKSSSQDKNMKKPVTRAFLLETLDEMMKRIINPESIKLEKQKKAMQAALKSPEPLKALSVARSRYRAEAQRQSANLRQTGSTSGVPKAMSPGMFGGTYVPRGSRRGIAESELAMYTLLKERTDQLPVHTPYERLIKDKMRHPDRLTIKDLSEIKNYLDFTMAETKGKETGTRRKERTETVTTPGYEEGQKRKIRRSRRRYENIMENIFQRAKIAPDSNEAIHAERIYNELKKDVSAEGFYKGSKDFFIDDMVAFMANPSSFRYIPKGIHEYLHEFEDDADKIPFIMIVKGDNEAIDIVKPFVERLHLMDILDVRFRDYVFSMNNCSDNVNVLHDIMTELERIPKQLSNNQEETIRDVVNDYIASSETISTPKEFLATIRVKPSVFLRILKIINLKL